MDTLLEKYTQLNDSFNKKKLTYRLGVEAGFFSEYNNMLLAMLYCLENKIRFKLYSKDANFKYEKGWADYFLPFCQEDSFAYQRHNPRVAVPSKKYDPRVILHHILKPKTFLTFELWPFFRDQNREKQYFDIPELGIAGNLQDACSILVQLTWRYNEVTKKTLEEKINSLQLPEKYIGFHIRSGDKIEEAELFNVSQYVEKVKQYTNLRDAFLSTDDYSIVETFRTQFKDWNIYTLCKESERGYFQKEFEQKDQKFMRQHHENLFASIDILKKSTVFVGTFSSNIGMYIGMCKQDNVISIDWEKWQIR
ncbi:MAG: hypothetical protein LBU22_03915 [Dysgonamonadaceae bacterium]|jgi:hypothetical protein|nr:hypothetical protein [Dysgonamonadaceae bacterium]